MDRTVASDRMVSSHIHPPAARKRIDTRTTQQIKTKLMGIVVARRIRPLSSVAVMSDSGGTGVAVVDGCEDDMTERLRCLREQEQEQQKQQEARGSARRGGEAERECSQYCSWVAPRSEVPRS